MLALVSKRRRRTTTVAQGLHNRAWVGDIHGALGPAVMVQYVELWRALELVTLSPDPDVLRWKWTDSGVYTASSCYQAMFSGSTIVPHCKLIWRTWAPLQVRVFVWLADQDRCWSAARLARHGLPHDERCIFCDQVLETLDHLLLQCSFSRIIWHEIFAWCRLLIPPPAIDDCFLDWWA